MKFAAMIFLVLVIASALSAPNPFRFFGHGGSKNLPQAQASSNNLPQAQAADPQSLKKPGKPDDPDRPDRIATGPRPLITLPFAPALNVPFYVPTIFGPRPSTTSLITSIRSPSGLAPAPPIYSTIPVATGRIPTNIPLQAVPQRRGAPLALSSVPVATPLPIGFVHGRPAVPFDVEPVDEAKKLTI